MTDETEKPATERRVEINNPQGGLPAVYANHVSLGATAFDVRLVFGQIVDVNPERVVIEQSVMVTMSWIQIKILGEVLNRNIKAFEEVNGELALPKVSAVVLPDRSMFEKKTK